MSKSPSLRRIQADIRELALDPSDRYHAAPLEHDMFEWHFTIRGADDTDFAGGVYHGRLILPPEYPFKPPHIIFLTKSGRFETNTKVCLSFSAFHPELWQPAWGVRLILEALISFLPTPADGALGALDWSSAERRKLAQESVNFFCPVCKCHAKDLLPELKKTESRGGTSNQPMSGGYTSRFQKEIQELQRLQLQEHARNEEGENDKKESSEVSATADSPIATTSELNNTVTRATPLTRSGNDPVGPIETTVEDAAPKGTMVEGHSSSSSRIRESAEIVTESNAKVSVSAQTGPAVGADVVDESNSNNSETIPILPEVQTSPQPRVQQHVDEAESPADSTKTLDPLLHAIIILLSIIVFLQLRKIKALMSDLRALDSA